MAQTAEILEALPPAQEQPAGLALLDLNVTATPLVITWDKDAVSTLLDTVLAQYAGLEVQEADVPAIKNEMAGLNRLKERMDNARKDIKRRIAGPLDGFDAEVKALIARIVDARAALDTQVKDFERRDREGRRAAAQCVVDNIKSCEGVPELDIPINPSWLNKSTRQAEIHEDIKRIIAAYKRECEETRRMEQAKADRIALVEATARGNPSSCSMNGSGRGSAGLTTGVGLFSSRALASVAYTCPMMPAASSPEIFGVRQAANFDRGSANGVDIAAVAAQLGHKYITPTGAFYTHALASSQRRAATCLPDCTNLVRNGAENNYIINKNNVLSIKAIFLR